MTNLANRVTYTISEEVLAKACTPALAKFQANPDSYPPEDLLVADTVEYGKDCAAHLLRLLKELREQT